MDLPNSQTYQFALIIVLVIIIFCIAYDQLEYRPRALFLNMRNKFGDPDITNENDAVWYNVPGYKKIVLYNQYITGAIQVKLFCQYNLPVREEIKNQMKLAIMNLGKNISYNVSNNTAQIKSCDISELITHVYKIYKITEMKIAKDKPLRDMEKYISNYHTKYHTPA